jgi:hypothetical protein
MESVLQGELNRFEVPDILTFLNVGRSTGVLVMERPEQETKLFFRDGNPVFATTTKEDLRLGPTLVRSGKVTAAEMEKFASRRVAVGHRIGQVLLQERVLTEQELATFLKIQVSEVIFDTFNWRQGRFVFYDKIPPPATAVTLEMALPNLVMEGVRRIDERARLKEVFPDQDLVLEAVANPERVKHTVTLTPEEWRVFFLVDGRRSLGEVCKAAGNPDELATLQVIHNLLVARFVTLVAPGAAGAPPAEGEGTQKFIDGRPAPPGRAPAVEFSPAVPVRKPEDDTKEIVRPQAIPYLDNSKKVTVSRLVLVEDGNETSFPLTRDSYTLGRHKNNDIVVTDAKVSSFHARIDRSADGFQIVDLKSRNGTFVNGKKVESRVLKTGDEVRLGTAKLIYKVDYTSSVT